MTGESMILAVLAEEAGAEAVLRSPGSTTFISPSSRQAPARRRTLRT